MIPVPGESPINPLKAVWCRFLDVARMKDVDGEPDRIVFHIETIDDGIMHTGALSLSDAREMGERLLAEAEKNEPE
jgi:hypothetical protein